MAQPEVQNGGAEKVAVAPPAIEVKAVLTHLKVKAPKADDAVKFYKAAFGAVELDRITDPKRKADQERPYVFSARLKLGSSTILVSDNIDDSGEQVKAVESGAIALYLEVSDVEAAVYKAVEAGAVADGQITPGGFADDEQLVGKVKDPFGYLWFITASPTPKPAAVSVQPRILL